MVAPEIGVAGSGSLRPLEQSLPQVPGQVLAVVVVAADVLVLLLLMCRIGGVGPP